MTIVHRTVSHSPTVVFARTANGTDVRYGRSSFIPLLPFGSLPRLPSTNTNESDPPNTQQRYRLINLVAEDNAIEDTIYHLHRALNTGRVDLERFLRVRASFLSVFCVCLCTCVWWV